MQESSKASGYINLDAYSPEACTRSDLRHDPPHISWGDFHIRDRH